MKAYLKHIGGRENIKEAGVLTASSSTSSTKPEHLTLSSVNHELPKETTRQQGDISGTNGLSITSGRPVSASTERTESLHESSASDNETVVMASSGTKTQLKEQLSMSPVSFLHNGRKTSAVFSQQYGMSSSSNSSSNSIGRHADKRRRVISNPSNSRVSERSLLHLENDSSTDNRNMIHLESENELPIQPVNPCYISLNDDVIRIGRSKHDCNVLFSDKAIFGSAASKILSRNHATIVRRKVTTTLNNSQSQHPLYVWTIRDHDSMNGTYVNGKKLQGKEIYCLVNNDIIKFGPSLPSFSNLLRFKFVTTDGPVAPSEELDTAQQKNVSKESTELRPLITQLLAHLMSLTAKLGLDGHKSLSSAPEQEAILGYEGKLLLKDVTQLLYKQLNDQPFSSTITELLPISDKKVSEPKRSTETSLPYAESHSELLERLQKELSCAICCELFLYANTLSCGHSFCKGCIDKWLQTSLTCPLCRNYLTRVPVQSHSIDKTIQIILYTAGLEDTESEESSRRNHHFLPASSQNSLFFAPSTTHGGSNDDSKSASTRNKLTQIESFLARKREYEEVEKDQEEKRNRLIQLLQEAKTRGYTLVHASKPWSDREQMRFLEGIKTYAGPARVAYCSAVNLTEDFINKATAAELVMVCQNLRILPTSGRFVVEKDEDVNYARWAEEDTGNVRCRLLMFAFYG